MSAEQKSVNRKTPEILVTFVGLIYSALYLAYVIVPVVIASLSNGDGIPGFAAIIGPFIVLFLAMAFLVWKANRFGFVGALVLSAFFIILQSSFVYDALGNPGDYSTYTGVITVFLALFATLAYSILGVRMFWMKGSAMQYATMPRSSSIALLIAGFVIGALFVGVFAGATQNRILQGIGSQSDISIVNGAANIGNPSGYYSPTSFSTHAGTSVTWVNKDGASHTVTDSATTNAFDSGSIASGATWSKTFDSPGTYQYYCTFHPFMKGNVTVTP